MRREWLSIVFIDMVDFTRTSNELPPEALVELINKFIAAINGHVENWGGHVSKFLGDGVLCVFPADAPEARENAAEQAVRCASQLPVLLLALNGGWRRSGYTQMLKVSCGIASGFCCSGNWGGTGRLDYTVIGPPVNLAQRLQVAARQRGDVLMDETTQRLIRAPSRTGQGDALTLNGFGQVTAYRLGDVM